jgi:hypothetical protein
MSDFNNYFRFWFVYRLYKSRDMSNHCSWNSVHQRCNSCFSDKYWFWFYIKEKRKKKESKTNNKLGWVYFSIDFLYKYFGIKILSYSLNHYLYFLLSKPFKTMNN